jgi:hypothetical protein
MKKLFIVFILGAVCFSLSAQNVSLQEEINNSMEKISTAFKDKYPDLTVKRGAVILEFEEESPRARSKKMGTLVRVYLEEALVHSLSLYLVDRKNLESIKEEQILSLTGLVDENTAPEVGYLSGAHVLLFGSILEEGADFLVTIGMTDMTTGERLLTFSFRVPDREMIMAAENLQYEYVTKNGIGLSVSTQYHILADEMFNEGHPLFFNIEAKYRISRNLMVSAGVMIPPVTTGSFYRYDPSQDSSLAAVPWSYFQPDLPAVYGTQEVEQITNRLASGLLITGDIQYTFNFSPRFNIGVKLGVLAGAGLTTAYRLSSTASQFIQTTVYDDVSGAVSDTLITRDYQEIILLYDQLAGAKVEIRPEFFITPRLAVTGIAGYMKTTEGRVREAYASHGDWGFYQEALDSGYNGGVEETYFGLDPRKIPGGGIWTLDFSGLYAGLALSFFF